MTSGHPFLTTPTAPFLALTAAGGIRFLSERRSTLAVASLLVAGFVAQSALTLSRAHAGGSFPYYGEVSRVLGAALLNSTGPEERSLVRLAHDPHISGWYGDRRIDSFDSKARTLEHRDTREIEREIDQAALIRRLGTSGHGYSWFVTTTASVGRERIRSLKSIGDEAGRDLYDFESDRTPSELVTWLRAHCREERRDGFLFFDLRSLK